MRKSAIRCSICGKAAPPGALLCPPCRAALKRAGHLTVQDLPHYLAPVRRTEGKGRRPADVPRPAPVAPPKPAATGSMAGRRALLTVAALAALAGVAYVGQPHPDPDRGASMGQGRAGSEPSSAAMGVPPVVPETRGGASSVPAVAPVPPSPAVMEPARPVAARVPARTKQAALRAEAIVAEGALPVAESDVPAPPPPVQVPRDTPPPPDRWQQMSDALARCDREGGFSGFICDQRVRLDSCEGYWGKVPQCPNPPENPR